MEWKYKEITGRPEEDKNYDLKNEDDVNKII